VSTTEVEQALGSHPHVAAAQVVGVPHQRWGEVGAAFVILREPVEPHAILEHARSKLASFKLPEYIFPVDSFPVTAGTEKVQKFRLREQALDRLRQIQQGDMK
jgi:acyl-CoA synthetase (AMP-forming)/AMP-acid ligase II